MLFDISHQEFDCQDGYHKSHHHTQKQNHNLCSGKAQAEFYDFQKTCAKHDRNSQEKGKLCRYCSGCTHQNTSDDGRAGTGGTRDHGKHLETADKERRLKGQIFQAGAGCCSFFVVIFYHNEKYTVYDQRNGYHDVVHKLFFNKVVKRKCDHNGRNTCHDNLKPQNPFVFITEPLHKSQDNLCPFWFAFDGKLCSSGKLTDVKRPQLIPIENHYCQNSSQLDHHQE